jgi:hypothetical protein
MTKHEKVCTSYEEQLYDLHPGIRLIKLERWWSRSSEDSWETNPRECTPSISNPWSPQIRSCSDGQHLRLNIIAKRRVRHSLKQTSCTSRSTGRQDCSSCKTAWLWSASRSETYGTGKMVIQIHRLNPSSICKWFRVLQWRIFSFFQLGKKIGRRKKTLHCKTLNHTILFIDWILLQSVNDLRFTTEDSFPSSNWETELE